jgi:hypothetical protein
MQFDTDYNEWVKEFKVSSMYVSPKVYDMVQEDEARYIKKENFLNRLGDELSYLLGPKIRKLWVELTK